MSIVKDLFAGGAEKKAARQRVQGITQGIDEQRGLLEQVRGGFDPAIERGGAAGDQLAALLGIGGPGAEQAALASFQESPGQAFLRERQERSLLRNTAATGGLRGGNVLTALQEQASGIAGQQLGERKNRLAQLLQGSLGLVGQQAGLTADVGGGITDLITGRGEAKARGIEDTAAARRSGLARVAGAFI